MDLSLFDRELTWGITLQCQGSTQCCYKPLTQELRPKQKMIAFCWHPLLCLQKHFVKHARVLCYENNFAYSRNLINQYPLLFNLMWIHKGFFPPLGFTCFLVTVITIGSGYLSMNSDCDDHLDLKSRSGWNLECIFLTSVNEDVLFTAEVCAS